MAADGILDWYWSGNAIIDTLFVVSVAAMVYACWLAAGVLLAHPGLPSRTIIVLLALGALGFGGQRRR